MAGAVVHESSRLPHRSRRWMTALLLVLAAAYTAYFSFYTCLLHEEFGTFAYDLGTFDQGIWLAGHGTDYFVTVRGLHLLGDHVRLFSFVLAPLYWIWDDVRALLALQSIVIAAGSVFVWRIAARELPQRPWTGFVLAVSWLLHPAVQNLNLDHAHPDAFASTFLLAAVDFLGAGRMAAFAIAAALAMSCKEDVPLVFVAMGCAMMLDRSKRRAGFAMAAAAGAYFALCLLVILPHFNDVGFFRYGKKGFLTGFWYQGHDPRWLLGRLFRRESATYLFQLSLPNLGLFLLAPLAVVPALPAFLTNLVADGQYMRSLALHYQTSILPFLYVGTILAVARLSSMPRLRETEGPAPGALLRVARAANRALPLFLLAAAVTANSRWSAIPLRNMGEIAGMAHAVRSASLLVTLNDLVARVPPDAVVSADYSVVPHLTHRRFVYMFPNPFAVSNWGVDGENPHDPDTVEYVIVRDVPGPEQVKSFAESLVADGRLEVVAGDEHARLYRRTSRVANAVCGDWNGDGVADEADVRPIATAIVEKRRCPLRICDTDGDGLLRPSDAQRLMRFVRDGAPPLACPK